MDPVSGLKGDVYRTFTGTLLPGLLGGWLLIHQTSTILESDLQIEMNGFAAGVITIVIGVAVGLLFDHIGTSIEWILWERYCKDKEFDSPTQQAKAKRDSELHWANYLKLKVKDEYIAQRYIQQILNRLKFELNMIPALPLSALSFVYCFWDVHPKTCASVCITSLVLMAYLLYQARWSIDRLSEVRHYLLEAVDSDSDSLSSS